MSTTSNPYGIRPIGSQGGLERTVRVPSGIASGYGTNIFKWSAVTMNPATGTLQAVTNPGGVPQRIWGFFAGCEFTPLGSRPSEFPYWPAGSTPDPNYDFFVYIWPAWDPTLRLQVQADGSVPQALLGSQFNITNVGAGSTATGLSACTVGAAGVAQGSQGQLVLTEFATDNTQIPGSVPGDSFTDLICAIAYSQAGPASQPSIG